MPIKNLLRCHASARMPVQGNRMVLRLVGDDADAVKL